MTVTTSKANCRTRIAFATGCSTTLVRIAARTAGTFHVAEGGLPIPGDKRAVPEANVRALFQAAVDPPRDLLRVPFTANQEDQGVLLDERLLRPAVCPEVPGYCPEKTMEVRVFAPGTLTSNLDFVESIFGNAGDPFVPMNDARSRRRALVGSYGLHHSCPAFDRSTKPKSACPTSARATAAPAAGADVLGRRERTL